MNTPIRHTIALAIAAALAGVGTASAAGSGSSASAQGQGGMQAGSSMHTESGALMSLRAEELDDMDVKTQGGDAIGEVDGLVRSKDDNELYLIIETGGIFDIGDTEVVVRLNSLQLREDHLILSDISSQEELESQEKYDAARFQSIDDDETRTLAELSGGAAAGAAMAGQVEFDELDADDSGYITEAEAKKHDALEKRWDDIDANQDDRIDRSEFSAFEVEEGGAKLEKHMEPSGQAPEKGGMEKGGMEKQGSTGKQEGSSSRY